MRLTDAILRKIGRVAAAAVCAALLCCGVAGCVSEAPDQNTVIEEDRTPLLDRTEEQEAELAEEERATDAAELGYMPGQIVVVYDSDATEAEREEAVESIGAEEDGQMAEFDSGDVSSLVIDENKTVETAVREAEAEDAVLYAAPNYLVDLFDEETAEPVDPVEPIDPVEDTDAPDPSGADTHAAIAGDNLTSQQWYLDFVRAPQAWKLLANKGVSKKVKVAVLDTGASLTHPDLKNVINRTDSAEVVWTDGTDASSWKTKPLRGDGYTNGGKAIDEMSSHGTHVSGIIAAEAGNEGIAGVASGAGTAVANKLVDLVVIDAFSLLVDDGAGGKKANASLMDLVFAMQYARDKGCKVINMSLGVQSEDSRVADLFDSLCKELTQKNGILIVSAAGNSNSSVKCYPAACDTVMGVISVSERKNSSGSSRTFLNPAWGNGNDDILRSYFSNYGTWCDISAPGENIQSTVINNGTTNSYRVMQGTSMACPVVAATAAMVMAANPSLSATQVKDILCKTATDLNTKGKDAQTGYGAMNAEAAVAYALGGGVQTYAEQAPTNLKDAQVSAATAVYSGAAQTPKVTVKMGSVTLTQGTDYTVSYKTSSMKTVGTYTVTVQGKGGYTGSKSATFTIQPATVSAARVTVAAQTYSGAALTPAPTVVVKNITLVKDTDYTVTYSNNRAVGTATATIKGKGNYTGTVNATFAIKAPASSATASSAKSSSTASPGAASGTSSSAPVNGATSSTKNASASTPVSVAKKNLAAAFVSGVGSYYTYTGRAISPYPILRYGGQLLRAGVDYTVGFSNNRALGTATITMTGAGSYKGTLQMRFTIGAPKVNAPKSLKLKAGKKAFSASWKGASGKASGYELQYSTSKKFTKKTTRTVEVDSTGKSKLSRAVKKLKAKKTYYVRVRTVYYVGDQTFASSWTKTAKVKTKR